MNLEQIDTSTTAGKAEVMRLAAEGRQLVTSKKYTGGVTKWHPVESPVWNWASDEYAIISEPVGPEEVWVVLSAQGYGIAVCDEEWQTSMHVKEGAKVVLYIRADLAGEGK